MIVNNAVMDKLKVIKRASTNIFQLDGIKIGDFIADEFGKSGKVLSIEKFNRYQQSYYYFYLNKSKTILIIL